MIAVFDQTNPVILMLCPKDSLLKFWHKPQTAADSIFENWTQYKPHELSVSVSGGVLTVEGRIGVY